MPKSRISQFVPLNARILLSKTVAHYTGWENGQLLEVWSVVIDFYIVTLIIIGLKLGTKRFTSRNSELRQWKFTWNIRPMCYVCFRMRKLENIYYVAYFHWRLTFWSLILYLFVVFILALYYLVLVVLGCVYKSDSCTHEWLMRFWTSFCYAGISHSLFWIIGVNGFAATVAVYNITRGERSFSDVYKSSD